LRSVVLAEERASVRFSDALITVNEPMRERIRERTGTDRPVRVVMNLPDPPRVGHDQDDGAEEGVQRLVYSGSVTSRHGVDLILRAIALLAPDHPALRLRVLGDGPALDALRQLARDLGITDRVEFLGAAAVKDVATFLRGATAGLSTQREDDFGSLVFSMKVPEYIALGLPVVCAATRTMRHYFCDDEVFFFRPGDSPDLARAIREVLDGPGEARRRVLRGQRKLDQMDRVGQQATLVETVERLVRGQEP
jgi:glycosyltransferase involved in cell wall biosynthesis